MTLIEHAAQAAYQEWIAGLESVEPKWEDLPQDFRDRLVRAQYAGFMALIAAHEQRSERSVLDDVRDYGTGYVLVSEDGTQRIPPEQMEQLTEEFVAWRRKHKLIY